MYMDRIIHGIIPTSYNLNLNVGDGPGVGTDNCDQGIIGVKSNFVIAIPGWVHPFQVGILALIVG